MTQEERFKLITKDTEEVLTPEDLKEFLEKNIPLKHYIGFEISGLIHLGTGLACMQKVKDFVEAGADCSIFLADWHTWINDKLGGASLETVKKVAVGYFKEGLKASLKCVGGDPEKLHFVLGSDLYHNNDRYWQTVIDVSKHITLSRNLRMLDIMGRKRGEGEIFARLIYPPMQVADIFIQGINLAHAGTDQRKAHVVARDVAQNLKVSPLLSPEGKKIKPVAIHHHLLLGLGKPSIWPVPQEKMRELWTAAKMTKSRPETCVFIHDSPDEIKEKIKEAFCPPEETQFNPVMDWVRSLIFRNRDQLLIKREERHGGNVTFGSSQELEEAYKKGDLHPEDLKNGVAQALIDLLEPARKHFQKPPNQKLLLEMEELVEY